MLRQHIKHRKSRTGKKQEKNLENLRDNRLSAAILSCDFAPSLPRGASPISLMPTLLNPTTDDTRVYEIALLLPAETSDKEKSDTLKNVEELFAEKQLRVHHKDEWKTMGLAYPIKGQKVGQYVIFYVEGKPASAHEIDASLKIERGVLRHLTIKLPPNYEVVDWAEHFASWKASLEKEKEDLSKQHEEELKKKMVQRAIRQGAMKKEEEKPAAPSAPAAIVVEAELEKKIDELISDEDLKL